MFYLKTILQLTALRKAKRRIAQEMIWRYMRSDQRRLLTMILIMNTSTRMLYDYVVSTRAQVFQTIAMFHVTTFTGVGVQELYSLGGKRLG